MCIRWILLVLITVPAWGCARPQADPQAAERQFWSAEINNDRLDAFVLANARFTLLHEMAHYVFSDYRVPLGGRPEDAADRLAIWLMTPRQPGGRPEDEVTTSPKASDLVWVAYFWINRGRGGVQERGAIPWFDEHGVDEQRGYQMLCLLYGSNPARFTLVADEYGLPEDRRRSCVTEAANNAASWLSLVGGTVADEAERRRNLEAFANQDRLIKSQPPGVLYADSQPTELFVNVPWFPWNSKSFLQRHEVLENLVKELLALHQRPGSTIPLVLATSCDGVANALYSPDDREIVICYPLVDRFSWSGRKLLWDVEQARQGKTR